MNKHFTIFLCVTLLCVGIWFSDTVLLQKQYLKYIQIATVLLLVVLYYVQPELFKELLGVLAAPSPKRKRKTAWTTNKKRKVTQLQKKVVASKQKWNCGHCKKTLDASFEVDHIVPLYKGGTNDSSNLMALCRNCHGMKTIRDAGF